MEPGLLKGRAYHRGTPSERFEARVEKGDGCWEFQGHRHKGYGKFGVSPSESVLAHRFAYELWVGEIPEGTFVHHLCENAACVRPDHLVLAEPSHHSTHHIRERGYVINQFGTWPVARSDEERRRRNRDWMRAKRARNHRVEA
jgi:hypothetical protein